MWNTVVDRNGRAVSRQTFTKTLREDHQTSVMVEILDTGFRQVEGGTIFSAERSNELTNFITDGNIDVDRTRAIRRTGELTLLNPTAEFTPATENFESEGPWVGMIYLNRMVRVYRGVYVGGEPYYVPVGTLLVDNAEVIVEQNMSIVNLVMSDRMKMMMKSYFGIQKVYDEGTAYNEIIRDLIDSAGVPLTGKYAAVIDNLRDRPSDERRIGRKVKFERGESRGERLKEIADKWDIDVYFDPMGVFRSEDRRDVGDKKEVWHFYSSDLGDGMMVSLRRTFSDDNLYNHVIIIGTGKKEGIVRAVRADHNPNSKTRIELIGDRVFYKETDRISTQAEADKALDRAWKNRFKLIETIRLENVCQPMLEADDVIRITERDKVKINEKYRLDRFNIPLITGRQEMEMSGIIKRDEL